MSKQRVGFIGVGLMGHGMAKNIVEKGYPLSIIGHRNRKPVTDLVKRGAKEAKSPAEMAKNSDVIFICVTSSVQVEDLIRRKDGIKAGAHKGLIIVDCSTADPNSTIALAEELAPLGVRLIDAPLGRSPKEAEQGLLNTFVGADAKTLKEVYPLIAAWAENIIHVGPVGAGHKMKLVNNFVAMGYAALYAEALAIARRAGLSVAQFHAVIGSGRMRCGFYDTFMRWTVEGDPDAPKFAIANAHKDMRYLAAMANEAGAVNNLQALVKNGFAAMEAAGQGARHVPMLADFVAALNGLSPAGQEGS
jgi:3-hydroxyisobutyrate dehydrogenase-like beta-hydroxyacid dehydrogenase